MARVPVVPIGKPREAIVDEATYGREQAGHQPLEARLEERRTGVPAGWGDKYVARVHEKDKLTTRERLERLKDSGSARSSRSARSSTTASTSTVLNPRRPES